MGLLLAACSAERNNPVSKAYHNTTARYNGYFLAKEKLRLLEEQLVEQTNFDYSLVLPIYPPIDSTTAQAMAADLEDIKKKASIPIQYHKNSKWVDNSYILIGKGNYYALDFEEAVRTFKYINANSKSKDERHEALVWLMRSFMQLNELENAQQVSEYLRKERLNRDNARELYLARAHYHRLQQDTTQLIENLALSVPNFEDKDAQSRVRYTLGQLYQLTGQDKEAQKQYSKVLRNNPPYDLSFFSRLNLGQVTELADKNDLQRIEGYYQKMLKDDKNTEYRDKIYYEMARFELRQQQYDQALGYLNQSLRVPGALPNQNAYSYVLAGEIYFDNLQKYNLAAAYYDSAVQVYPKNATMYEAVADRRNVLANFAEQYSTIQVQDSLQRIAKMPDADRMTYLQELAQRQEEVRAAEQARQEQLALEGQNQSRRQARGSTNSDAFGSTATGGVWYFDNPAALATAQSEFARRWGDRPNQDFWRIRSRGETTEQAGEPIARAPKSEEAVEQQLTPAERLQAQVDTYLRELPLSTAAMLRSEKMTEDAYFKLGNIYAQNLKAPADAIETYEQLLKRFPRTEYADEVYYSLYLLYGRTDQPEQQRLYLGKIKNEFPSTIYARLVDDAGFREKNATNNLLVHALYDSAYQHFEAQEYMQTSNILNRIISQYPLNDIQDKVMYLDAMVAARTEKPEVLRQKLQRFRQEHKGSPLQQQATKLLARYDALASQNQLRTDAPPPPAPKQEPAPQQATPKPSTEIALATASTDKVTPPLPQQVKAPVMTQPKQQEPVAAATPVATPPAPVPATQDALAAPEKDKLAYSTEADSAFQFVLLYPTGEQAFEGMVEKYEKYNSMYFRGQPLNVETQPYGNGQTMLLVRGFTDANMAKTYTIKQKGPQAPVGRIRGIDFTTFAISSGNYSKFVQKKDLEEYLAFYKNNY